MKFFIILITIYLYASEIFTTNNYANYSIQKQYTKNNFTYTETLSYLDTNKTFINNYQNYYLNAYNNSNPKNQVNDMVKMFDSPRKLFNNVNISLFATTQNTTTIKNEKISYFGGAHGSYNVSFQNFYHQLPITLKDIITNKNKLLEIAKQHYKFIHLMKEKTSLIEDNWFEDKFILPQNFAITNRGILFYYNSYEIKPYSEGHTKFILPYYKLKNICRLKFKQNPIIFKTKYGKITIIQTKENIIFKIKNYFYTNNEKIYIKLYGIDNITKEYQNLDYDTEEIITINKPNKETIIDIKVLFDKNQMPENIDEIPTYKTKNGIVYRFSIL